ncbi:MAG: hypothetical protein PW734_05340 [Verrucomicrobium sp.]|nr:hypothetical protein [Verrucomicrobium sp.]
MTPHPPTPSAFLRVFFTLFALYSGVCVARADVSEPDAAAPAFPWHRHIVTTVFWIGADPNHLTATQNFSSAWDAQWIKTYGGTDAPDRHAGLLPKRFAPTENPFYVALPFNDVSNPDLARKYVPWYSAVLHNDHPYVSQCKGRWVQIRGGDGHIAYAQWQDVGPLRTDHAAYVFGSDRPRDFTRAGLDISPAVRDYLGLSDKEETDWRFVEDADVPAGPWRTYAEQAVIYAALKAKERQLATDWRPAPKQPQAVELDTAE